MLEYEHDICGAELLLEPDFYSTFTLESSKTPDPHHHSTLTLESESCKFKSLPTLVLVLFFFELVFLSSWLFCLTMKWRLLDLLTVLLIKLN